MLTTYNPALGRLALRAAASRNWARANPSIMARSAWAAARTIGRAYRSYRRYKRKRGTYNGRINTSLRGKKRARFSPRMVGMPNGSSTSKSTVVNNETQVTRQTRTLYQLDLTAVGPGTDINRRLRQHVKMTGWKICMEIRCTINTPLYLNIAVLAPKQTTNDTIEATNFFRNNEDARSMDFSINRTGLEMHCCPINSDDYTILKHRRYVLNTVNQPTASWSKQSGSSWINVNWWVPLRRQVRYLPGESSTATDGRVFHVFWFDVWGNPSGTAAANCANVSSKVITYFREPRN